MIFQNREDAGRRLAALLGKYRGEDVVVLALPRGGVPVGFEIARALGAPLDVILVRKIGAPMEPELAMGAIAEDGAVLLDQRTIDALGVTSEEVEQIVELEAVELHRRKHTFRGDRGFPDLSGKTVIVVDDGLATGATARAAIRAIYGHRPKRIVLAVPVAAEESLAAVAPEVDEIACAHPSRDFRAVGLWYRDFDQTSDEDVIRLLDQAHNELKSAAKTAKTKGAPRAPAASASSADDEYIAVPIGNVTLEGDLAMPTGARGLVLFAHGSGSSRFSPRNRHVASVLREAGLGTLLLDLLTPEEGAEDELTGHLRFDIDFLASRVIAVLDWLGTVFAAPIPVGLFGASTGAAAALIAASHRPKVARAVVSRGGRPDLAMHEIALVRAPTLLIVGGQDYPVTEMNRAAFERLTCEKQLVFVPGATHLFEEPGALDEVARLAVGWFQKHLVAASPARRAA